MSIAVRMSSAVIAVALVLAGCRGSPSNGSSRANETRTDPGHDSRQAAGERDSLASAQVPTVGADDVEVFPAAELEHVADELAGGSGNGQDSSGRAARRYIETRRTASGVPEVHDNWTDVTVVQSGRATLLAGGRVEGTRATSPGEHRGGTIHGGAARVVSAGDSFIIPAGVPHEYKVAPGDSIRYLTIKVARPHAAPR